MAISKRVVVVIVSCFIFFELIYVLKYYYPNDLSLFSVQHDSFEHHNNNNNRTLTHNHNYALYNNHTIHSNNDTLYNSTQITSNQNITESESPTKTIRYPLFNTGIPFNFSEPLFTHIFSPYIIKGELPFDQLVVGYSMERSASEALRHGVEVQMLGVIYENDSTGYYQSDFIQYLPPALQRSWRSQTGYSKAKEVPYLADILQNGIVNGKGKYAIYSNSDITLHPNFYTKVSQMVYDSNLKNEKLSSMVINRRVLFNEDPNVVLFQSLDDFEKMVDCVDRFKNGTLDPTDLCKNTDHSGNDLFVFPLEWLPHIISRFPNIILGSPPVGCVLEAALNWQCKRVGLLPGQTKCHEKFWDEHITFHLGVSISTTIQFPHMYNLLNTNDAPECIFALRGHCERCYDRKQQQIICPEIFESGIEDLFRSRCVK